MRIVFSGKIAKNGKYLTKSDDIRLIRKGDGKWSLVGFAHNPDGQDLKRIKLGGISGVLIDTPQFFGIDQWDSLDEARKALEVGNVHITFDFLDNKSYGECVLYEIKELEEE